jgi:membrane associated rhomboid family serine protease
MGALITCQKCRALLEPGTKECPYCQTDQRHHAANPWLVLECGQWWRLLAATFLHADLLHLALNSIALLYLIPVAAGALGVHRTVCVYFASGILGATVSVAEGNGGVGASGALCGLIGACLAWGKRRGGMVGDAIAYRMISWAVVIAIMGLWSSRWSFMRVDNAAHLGGFLAGGALGWVASGVRARGGAADRAWTLAARGTVVASVLVALAFWAPFAFRIFERREVEMYRLDADRTLAAVGAALRDGKADGLPDSFPDGPGGTADVRDAVREALDLARSRDARAGEALARAHEALDAWSSTLVCEYVLSTG